MTAAHRPLIITALALVALPFVLQAFGLTYTSASEVVIFAIACMALNILVGHTGLVSFGHGAWFGLAAYAAAIVQRELFRDSFIGPVVFALIIVAAVAAAFGFLILRRRGVYFSLMTLALSALLYVVAFRWTDVTGGGAVSGARLAVLATRRALSDAMLLIRFALSLGEGRSRILCHVVL